MIKTVKGLTYGALDATLKRIGYVREEGLGERMYRHPADNDAFITYPPLPFSDEVREYHLLAARQIADGFGILGAHDFDLLFRAAHAEAAPA